MHYDLWTMTTLLIFYITQLCDIFPDKHFNWLLNNTSLYLWKCKYFEYILSSFIMGRNILIFTNLSAFLLKKKHQKIGHWELIPAETKTVICHKNLISFRRKKYIYFLDRSISYASSSPHSNFFLTYLLVFKRVCIFVLMVNFIPILLYNT